MEEDGRLYYVTGIDNSQMKNDAEESKRILHSIDEEAASVGSTIDASLSIDNTQLNNDAEESRRILHSIDEEAASVGNAIDESLSIDNAKLNNEAEESRRILQSIGEEGENVGNTIEDSISIDNNQLDDDADDSKRILRSIGIEGERAGDSINAAFSRVGKTIAATFTVKALSDFTRNIIKVRSEIESLEISFNTLLGDKDKAEQMLGEIRQFAVQTPMMISDLAKGAKTLLSFNVAAEKVMPTLKAIGDISMGDAGKFQSLTLAFAQMSSTGKLMGQDLLQMINAGFNPLAEISERTGKSIADLKEEMSKGAISAEMVTQAFIDATSEGGKFNDMLEKQSKGLTGSISNLKGAIDDMLNDLGEKMQDSVSGIVQHTTEIVRNYEKVGDALSVLIAGYGSYKAAVIATNLVMKSSAFAENIRLVKAFRKELGLLKAAQQAFNLSAMSNPYIIMASAIVAATVAIAKLVKHKREEEQAIIDSTKEMRNEYTQTNMLIGKLKDANLKEDERRKILEQLRQINPDIVEGIDEETTAFEKLNERLDEYNKKQLAAIAVKQFSKREDFDEAVEDLIKARDNMESANADMVNLWSTIYDRYLGMLEKGDEIPESIKTMMDSLTKSGASEAEKVEAVFSAWRQIEDRIKQSHGAYSGISEGRYTFDALLGGLSDREYRKTSDKLDKIEDIYHEKAENLKAKIEQIALSIYTTDEAARQQFIDSQMALYFPESNQKDATPTIENQEEKKNKAYWESFKKKKEDELAALTDAELNSKKAVEIRKEIAEAEKKITAYSVSYKDSNRTADETADRKAKIDEYVQARISEEQAAEFEIRQAAINAQKDGFDKQIQQAQLDYDRLIAANEERQRQMVERMKDEKLNEWMVSHPKATKEQQLAFRATITEEDLTAKQKGMLEAYAEIAADIQQRANKKALEEMLADYQTYDQKRLKMEIDFGETSKAIAKGMADERGKLLERSFSSYVNLTADDSEAQKQIASMLTKWKDDAINIGIDADDESIAILKKRLEEIRDKSIELGVDTSGVDFGKLLDSLDMIQGKTIKVGIDVDNAEALEGLKNRLTEIRDKAVGLGISINDAGLTDIEAALNALQSKDVELGVNTSDTKAIDELNELISQFKDKSVELGINIDNAGLMELESELKALQDKTVNVELGIEKEEAISALIRKLQEIRDKAIKIGVDAKDDDGLSELEAKLDNIQGKNVELGIDVVNTKSIEELKDLIGEVRDKSVELGIDLDDEEAISRIKSLLNQLNIFQRTKFRAELEVDLDEIDDTAYSNIEDRMAAINKAYDVYIEKLETAGASEAELVKAKQEQEKSAGRLTTLIAQQEELEEKISTAIQNNQEDTEVFKKWREELRKISKEIEEITRKTDKATKGAMTLKEAWADAADAIKNADIGEQLDAVGGFIDKMSEVEGSGGFSQIFDLFKNIASGNLVGLFGSIVDIFVDDYMRNVERFAAIREAQLQARLDALENHYEDLLQGKGNVFGDDVIGDAEDYLKLLNEISQRQSDYYAIVNGFDPDRLRWLQENDPNWTDLIGRTPEQILHEGDILNHNFLTNKGFLGFGKEWMNLQQLSEQFGISLYDEYDHLNAELAQIILNTYDNTLSPAEKEFLNGVIEDSEAYKNAMDSIANYLTDLFGGVADTIADNFINSFLESGQAAANFGNVVSDVAKSMVKDLIKSKILTALDPFSQQLQNIMTGEGSQDEKIAAMMAVFASMQETMDELTPDMQAILEAYQQFFDMGDSGREPSTKGIAQASQDSVDELNGRMTTVQGHTYSISENTILIQQNTANIMQSVMNIERDVNDMDNRIYNVETMTTQMRNTLDDFRQNGIRIR